MISGCWLKKLKRICGEKVDENSVDFGGRFLFGRELLVVAMEAPATEMV